MHVDVSAFQRDSLTGLANRAMFDAQLDLAVSLAREYGRRTGVIIVDVNRMKLINDVHGHRVGDEALLAVAAEIRKMGGADCVTARIGGDEFGTVLSANCDALTAPRLRANLKSGVVCSTSAAGKPVFVSASVGVALYPDDGTTASELLHLPTSQCTSRSGPYRSPNRVMDFGRLTLPASNGSKLHRWTTGGVNRAVN